MIKTGLFKSIENEEIIMTMTRRAATTVIIKIIILIRMEMRIKIGNRIKI